MSSTRTSFRHRFHAARLRHIAAVACSTLLLLFSLIFKTNVRAGKQRHAEQLETTRLPGVAFPMYQVDDKIVRIGWARRHWHFRDKCNTLSATEIGDNGQAQDAVELVHCEASKNLGATQIRTTSFSAVICFGNFHSAVNPYWLNKVLAYYKRVGFEHFFFYSSVESKVFEYSTWTYMPWVHNIDAHSFGQYWAIHDCLSRNKASNNEWILFVDADEILDLGDQFVDIAALTTFLSKSNFTAGTFGSVPQKLGECKHADAFFDRFNVRWHQPECVAEAEIADRIDVNFCLSSCGRRKYIAHAQSHKTLGIHDPMKCPVDKSLSYCRVDTYCLKSVNHFDASSIKLRHFRGAATFPNYTDFCTVRHCLTVKDQDMSAFSDWCNFPERWITG